MDIRFMVAGFFIGSVSAVIDGMICGPCFWLSMGGFIFGAYIGREEAIESFS